ncbi:hypothetical protein CBS101457_003655 [Exobasidium rhododendri]|nr:hypothetical protein CBS101457_003655 [Exobasidium rhododendri]
MPGLVRAFSAGTRAWAPSTSMGHLPGYPSSPFLSSFQEATFDSVNANTSPSSSTRAKGIPTYRLMDGVGNLLPKVEEAGLQLQKEEAVKIMQHVLLLPALDVILYNAQRQGRISFMMTSHGEEAAVIGSASALDAKDEVFAQYREMGVLLYRGFKLDQVMSQVFGTADDLGLARQMPVHFGSPQHHFHTISSPLATQIPQAAGAAFALKRMKDRRDNVVVCYFGEGAASEGDAHAGMNMAATLRCPVIFIVRNNGFAISTPSTEQYAGDGIASRGPGYGISTVRVDGNDILAVRSAVQQAKKHCLEHSRPFLIECMTYRVGHHSTSDDSSAYRKKTDVEDWKKLDNPISRFEKFCIDRTWWSERESEDLKKGYRTQIVKALEVAEKKKRPKLSSIFEDTYKEIPENLKQQRSELARLLQKYGDSDLWKKELSKYEEQGEDMIAFRPREEEEKGK